MEDNKYTITLADETKLENLKLNGNNFISDTPIEERVFNGNCSRVTISDGKNTVIYENAALVKLYPIGEGSGFILREITPEELEKDKMKSDIDYVAMMCDVEL